MSLIEKNIKRLQYASAGILFAIRTDYSFRIQLYLVGIVVVALIFIFSPVTQTEFLFVTLAYFLILITELQNSAFEAALDHLHPELHHNIGRSKDMAAGAVLLAAIFLIIVVVSLAVTRLL